MNTTEKKEIYELFANWLKIYSHEAIIRVMNKRDEIISNEYAMKLLIELKKRECEEETDFYHLISYLLNDFNTFKKYDPHSHPLTHANSYRDILYDLFISDR